MNRIPSRLAAAILALAIPLAVAGCFGSGGGGEDPQAVLNETFGNQASVTSGNLDLTLNVSAEGAQGGNLTASLSGPFQGSTGEQKEFPQFALTAKASGSFAGQSIDFTGGATATADAAYISYGGTNYQVPAKLYDSFKQAYAQQAQAAGSTSSSSASAIFKQLGIDPGSWITNLSNEGDADVGGTQTVHIHGNADVTQVLNDFVKIAQQAPGASLPQGLSQSQLDLVSSFIQNPTVDVYSGKDDHILRKLEIKFTVTPPPTSGAGVSSVSVDFAIALTGVNEPQTIAAPSGPTKPLNDLLGKLGISPGSLGSLPSLGGSSSSGGGAANIKKLGQCLQQAGSNTTAANACFQKYGSG